jgi:hypothetical protein
MAPALILIRQNTNRTRQIVACKRSLIPHCCSLKLACLEERSQTCFREIKILDHANFFSTIYKRLADVVNNVKTWVIQDLPERN